MILLEQRSKCYLEVLYHTLHSEVIQNYGQQRNENLTETVKARISSTSAEKSLIPTPLTYSPIPLSHDDRGLS